MADAATTYQRGLEGKPTPETDRIRAASKVPEERLRVLAASPWISGCQEISYDPDRCLTFLKHSSVAAGDLAHIKTAMSYVQQAPTGASLLAELRKTTELMVGIHFLARVSDYPWQSEVTPHESGHAKLVNSPASAVVLFHLSVFVAGRRLECIADTLFHELLHVWFLGKYSGYNETSGTGHDPGATIAIDPGCRKRYAGFHPDFQQALQLFEDDLDKRVPGATRCCS
jgi:hypothetical protein